MASKFSKLLFITATAAAAAGIYYYIQKKNAEHMEMYGYDDEDDFEDFDEDLDDEACKCRSYVSLNFDGVESAYRRAKEKITDSYYQVKDTVRAGFEGASVGMREFVDLTREEAQEAADEMAKDVTKKAKKLGDDAIDLTEDAHDAAKDALDKAEESVVGMINEGVTKVEDFFDEDET